MKETHTLEEAIQNYSRPGNDPQMLAWLEELRDLRAILKKRAPGEAEAEAIEAAGGEPEWSDDPVTLEGYLSMFNEYYIMQPAEKEVYRWAALLNEARKRVGDDA